MKGMICPECKGQRFKRIAPNTYECEYCGFIIKEESPQQPKQKQQLQQQKQKPVNVNVNVNNNSSSGDLFSSIEDGIGKGVGGCIGVIIVILFLLKSCGLIAFS